MARLAYVPLLLLAASAACGGAPAAVPLAAAVLSSSSDSIVSSASGRVHMAGERMHARRLLLANRDAAQLRAAGAGAATSQTATEAETATQTLLQAAPRHARAFSAVPALAAEAASAAAAALAPEAEAQAVHGAAAPAAAAAAHAMAGAQARASLHAGTGASARAGAGAGAGGGAGAVSPMDVLAPGAHASGSALARLFSFVEAERVRTRGGAPCPSGDQRRALTCLLLAILVPPAAYLYYGYVVVGAVQIVLYLLCLTPLCFACGWFCRPVTPKYRRAGAEPSLYESFSPAAEGIGSRTRALVVLLVCAGLLFLALIMWQVALVVRVATNDFPPANGCAAIPL